MKYHDTARPLNMSGRPMYLSPAGRSIAALPPWRLDMDEDGLPIVSIWLLTASVTAREFHCKIKDQGLSSLWHLWWNDPECVLINCFHYNASWADSTSYVEPTPIPKPKITLATLGLKRGAV